MSPKLTLFERNLNVCLEEYAKLNYLQCTSSAFCWEQENSITAVMFIHSPVESKFGIMESGHNTLRVAVHLEIIRKNTNYFKFGTTIEGMDDICMTVVDESEDGKSRRVSKIASSMISTVSPLTRPLSPIFNQKNRKH